MRDMAVTILCLMANFITVPTIAGTESLGASTKVRQVANIWSPNEEIEGDETVQAKQSTFLIVAAFSCPCKSSLVVQTDDKKVGNILDNQKVSSIKVKVNNETLELMNPPEGIRNYFPVVRFSEWLKEEMSKKGKVLSETDIVSLISFKANSNTPLYTDESATELILNKFDK